jgi:hypothetical protein
MCEDWLVCMRAVFAMIGLILLPPLLLSRVWFFALHWAGAPVRAGCECFGTATRPGRRIVAWNRTGPAPSGCSLRLQGDPRDPRVVLVEMMVSRQFTQDGGGPPEGRTGAV